jgi:hypothetical protein
VGGIAICGSEKTIVFRDNEEPPALTYPIGASGAIVSDQMDDEGSEFLVRNGRIYSYIVIFLAPLTLHRIFVNSFELVLVSCQGK